MANGTLNKKTLDKKNLNLGTLNKGSLIKSFGSSGGGGGDEYIDFNIIGSPTISDGVVSNFSSSNYLESVDVITEEQLALFRQKFILQLKVINPNPLENGKQIIYLPYRSNQSGIYTLSSGGLSWSISPYPNTYSVAYPASSVSVYEGFYLKAEIENNIATFSKSSDGQTWTVKGTSDITSCPAYTSDQIDKKIKIGIDGTTNSSNFFKGRIDIKEGFIQYGDVKKLIRIVGA